jgi:flagellar biosynthesis anti-sigma factor FlgM
MKVNDPNLSQVPGSSQAKPAGRVGSGAPTESKSPNGAVAHGDDVHLSELVRSLRSLAAESPERQAHLEQIARTHAQGNYQVDAHATAGKIIEDALRNR